MTVSIVSPSICYEVMGPDAMCVGRLIFMVTYFADGENRERLRDQHLIKLGFETG